MYKNDIIHIINNGENECVEFKTSFGKEVIESIVAFSNTKGGKVIVGVSDNKKIAGINVSDESIQNWLNQIKQNTEPQVIPEVITVEINKKNIIVFDVIEYPIKPVAFKNKFFKRVANSNHLMSINEITNEHLRTINTSWDFYPDPNHSVKDISIEKVNGFIKKIEQRTQNKTDFKGLVFLSKLEFIRNNQLSFGAYLLFVKGYCLISDVQVGRFKSETKIIDSISLNTDLFSETDEIIAFIKKHLMVEFIITGEPQRTERFDYPLDAIREIVVNMIVHRDYRDSSGSIIKIFDDRIEFYNPGNLFGGLTIKNLLSGKYSSKTRNNLIAKAFKEIGLIERYGSGIMRIQKICNELNLWLFNPLWQINEREYLNELLKSKFEIFILAIASYPFTKNTLGKLIDKKMKNELLEISDKYKISPVGEGGEFESFVLDSPLFKHKLEIKKSEKIMESENCGFIHIEEIIEIKKQEKLLRN